ncbi:hypothetical protein DNHGIG_35280 [Collibacillus ludicampi]|uniref:Citrate synthase n=1 Tax=Collibacillus ludicampi TaxID=2771369 RepID=A0AAV4LKL7_9BACL|nr:hypothetical protein DNHGIG_35280 [Collibacillus ludicampi]
MKGKPIGPTEKDIHEKVVVQGLTPEGKILYQGFGDDMVKNTKMYNLLRFTELLFEYKRSPTAL